MCFFEQERHGVDGALQDGGEAMSEGNTAEFGAGDPGFIATQRGEGDVGLAREAVLEIPGGLSVADEDEQRHNVNIHYWRLFVSRITGQAPGPSGQERVGPGLPAVARLSCGVRLSLAAGLSRTAASTVCPVKRLVHCVGASAGSCSDSGWGSVTP